MTSKEIEYFIILYYSLYNIFIHSNIDHLSILLEAIILQVNRYRTISTKLLSLYINKSDVFMAFLYQLGFNLCQFGI